MSKNIDIWNKNRSPDIVETDNLFRVHSLVVSLVVVYYGLDFGVHVDFCQPCPFSKNNSTKNKVIILS